LAAPLAEPVIVAEVITVVPNGDWTGFYGGAALGYADVGSTEDVLNGSGFLGGVLAGYRMDWGQWVGGVEADYDWSGIDLGEGDLGSLDAVGRLKLQVGYDMGRTLVYGTGGWAYGDATVAGASLSDWGWVAGVGVDCDGVDACCVVGVYRHVGVVGVGVAVGCGADGRVDSSPDRAGAVVDS
jgi:hypothetical protein